MLIEVFTDGSGTTANLPGGWAFLVTVDGVKTYEESGNIPKATNNTSEITAAIRGLEYVNKTFISSPLREVVLWSDSQLVLGYASGRYQCKAMHLLPLYLQIRKLYMSLNVKDMWVRGHSGHEHNERCDVLAKAAREGLAQSTNYEKKDLSHRDDREDQGD